MIESVIAVEGIDSSRLLAEVAKRNVKLHELCAIPPHRRISARCREVHVKESINQSNDAELDLL